MTDSKIDVSRISVISTQRRPALRETHRRYEGHRPSSYWVLTAVTAAFILAALGAVIFPAF